MLCLKGVDSLGTWKEILWMESGKFYLELAWQFLRRTDSDGQDRLSRLWKNENIYKESFICEITVIKPETIYKS